jgi:hypothetical protein
MGLTAIGALIAVGLLAWAFLPDYLIPSRGVSTGQGIWVIDRSNDRELVGLAQDVFFGQVIEKLGQTRKYGYPETQFNVKVLEVLKGSLSGTVKVNQQGGTRIDGTQWRMEGDPTLLDPGKSYLFVTRHLPAEDWHTVSPGYGNIKLQAPPNGTKEEVLGS